MIVTMPLSSAELQLAHGDKKVGAALRSIRAQR